MTAEAADIINNRRSAGGRIVAVGTTSVRVLESCADEHGRLGPRSGSTDIFIYPPYRFRAVDALLEVALNDPYRTNLGDPVGHPGHFVVRFAAIMALKEIDDDKIEDSADIEE